MSTHLRPRSALLTLELDADAQPATSDLVLATRDGELVWRGQACADAWRAGLRLRARWQGGWGDALWAMTLAVLDVELATHGLRREGLRPVDVVPQAAGALTRLQVRAPVVPAPVGRAVRVPAATVAGSTARPGAPVTGG
ncbi:hypothetical protein [uncultured Cellulomonas sp.]|uniref:hypothetical protein n=1 Tax=uncultured Cellulomonas sp. TaxID=189682 RepID=UPI00263830A9|nr:hypothetical protein [uncultured Cellulomonas sp.]